MSLNMISSPSISNNQRTPPEAHLGITADRFDRYNATDDIINCVTPSFQREIELHQYTSRVLTPDAAAQDILGGYLSPDTVVSTTFSFTRSQQGHWDNLDAQFFSEIGHGSYGVIFEKPGTVEIFKRPINLDGPRDNVFDLWNDYTKQTAIYDTFNDMNYRKIHILKPFYYITADADEWWKVWGSKFEPEYQTPSHLLCAERILPVPQPVRHALVDCFCPEQYRELTKQSVKNKLCLIHPLLGRRKGNHTIRGVMNLRNFELCVDQMEYLGIDVGSLIDIMAESLAILHFKVRVDAHDIEFVFGTAPTAVHFPHTPSEELEKMEEPRCTIPWVQGYNFHGRAVHLWMLDFNRVSKISHPSEYVRMAVKGFVDQSHAYYPRPRFPPDYSNDNKNWRRFRSVYLRCATSFCEDTTSDLPAQFLNAVEDYYQQASLRRGEL